RTGTIGVLATEASLAGEKFHHLVAKHARDLRVITRPCPSFVDLVEAGILAGPDVEDAIDEYTSEMIAADADVIILGCSHYPFLRPALENRLPDQVRFVDTGDAIARRVKEHVLTAPPQSSTKIFTTGPSAHFSRLIQLLTPSLKTTCSHLSLP
ncbi:MAG: glutamate racemase, partial [Akkermansiaceae bacterium]